MYWSVTADTVTYIHLQHVLDIFTVLQKCIINMSPNSVTTHANTDL